MPIIERNTAKWICGHVDEEPVYVKTGIGIHITCDKCFSSRFSSVRISKISKEEYDATEILES